MEQFRDVAEENRWTKRSTLLHMRGCLDGPASIYSRGESVQGVFEAPQTRYGTSAKQAQERLLGLKRDPQVAVYDLTVDIGCLVGLAHPYLPTGERDQLTVKYLVRSLDNRVLQSQLLIADTSMVASTVHTIKEYLAVGNSNRPTCKSFRKRERVSFNKWEYLANMPIAKSEVLAKMVARLKALELAFKGVSPVP